MDKKTPSTKVTPVPAENSSNELTENKRLYTDEYLEKLARWRFGNKDNPSPYVCNHGMKGVYCVDCELLKEEHNSVLMFGIVQSMRERLKIPGGPNGLPSAIFFYRLSMKAVLNRAETTFLPFHRLLEIDRPYQYFRGRLKTLGIDPDDIKDPQSTPKPDRIKWTCTTQAYIHIVKELVGKGYIELPGMNAKDGDGNVTEYLRRLSQAFIVNDRAGTELSKEELQRRWNGRRLSLAKANRLDFPEAKEL